MVEIPFTLGTDVYPANPSGKASELIFIVAVLKMLVIKISYCRLLSL